jgi:purine-binding chemotaxis protein CheW
MPTIFVTFGLDQQRYALPLAAVARAVRLVEITPLPAAPPVVAGVINAGGQVLPVFDLRARLGLPARPRRLSDQLLLVQLARRAAALLVDAVTGTLDLAPEQIAPEAAVAPGGPYTAGVATLPDGLVVITDLDRFLSVEEERTLDMALTQA